MRKLIIILGLVAAFAVPAATAAAAPPPRVICGTACDGGGGGWSGCTQQSADDHNGIRWVAYYRHFLVVSYCKQHGVITSLSIAAHGCDFEGAAACNPGAAWLTGGGVGAGFATFTAHAAYVAALGGVPFAGTSVVNLTIALG